MNDMQPTHYRATCNGTLHFSHWIRPGGSWHPEYLTPLHLPLVLEKVGSKQAFWGRKFDVEKGGAALMDALDYRRLCGPALESVGPNEEMVLKIIRVYRRLNPRNPYTPATNRRTWTGRLPWYLRARRCRAGSSAASRSRPPCRCGGGGRRRRAAGKEGEICRSSARTG